MRLHSLTCVFLLITCNKIKFSCDGTIYNIHGTKSSFLEKGPYTIYTEQNQVFLRRDHIQFTRNKIKFSCDGTIYNIHGTKSSFLATRPYTIYTEQNQVFLRRDHIQYTRNKIKFSCDWTIYNIYPVFDLAVNGYDLIYNVLYLDKT